MKSESTVHSDLCIGCGICSGICPAKKISIAENGLGEYRPFKSATGCHENCGLCVRVCPFSIGIENEDTIAEELYGSDVNVKHRYETGYYRESFVGHSDDKSHRENGASGGLATWALEKILEEGGVDKVVCVGGAGNVGRLYDFTTCVKPEEVRNCAGSCYYPVELSECLKQIIACDKTYAIIALPCFVKGLRLAMKALPVLAKRIKYLLGLTCGQYKSKLYAEYICVLGGSYPTALKSMHFRKKTPGRQSIDYAIHFSCENEPAGTEHKMNMSDGPGRMWSKRYFTPLACNFCDDTFAELADVTFMDAWLPECLKDYRGSSIVICRNKEIHQLFVSHLNDKTLNISPLEIGKVIQSQVSLVRYKRVLISERLNAASAFMLRLPVKRRIQVKAKAFVTEKIYARSVWQIQQQSPEAWVQSGKSLATFRALMTASERKVEFARKLNTLFLKTLKLFKMMNSDR